MATTSPGKGQDKWTCQFSGKGTHLRRMSSCTKSNTAHSRAGCVWQRTHVLNPPCATAAQHREQLGWEGATSLGGAQPGRGFLAELHRLLEVSDYQHHPSSSSRFLGGRAVGQQRAPASPDEEGEQEEAAPGER